MKWTRDDYEAALASDDYDTVVNAYYRAKRRAFDMRFRGDTRALAREYLPKLTERAREVSEAKLEDL